MISDNFFTIENRVKFFDIIIPIIPILNSKNSNEILLERLESEKLLKNKDEDVFNKLTKEKIIKLSEFIGDLRLLINLINEFLIYINLNKESNIDYDKLFGIIIYKNLYPDDLQSWKKIQGK